VKGKLPTLEAQVHDEVMRANYYKISDLTNPVSMNGSWCAVTRCVCVCVRECVCAYVKYLYVDCYMRTIIYNNV